MSRSMLLHIVMFFSFFSLFHHCLDLGSTHSLEPERFSIDIVDGSWDQIQKGQWLIFFFDAETEESKKLEENWEFLAQKCNDQNIKAGKIFAPDNPGLYVRFLVTVFPKVFFIKNGIAYEVKQPNQDAIMELIKDKKWDELKAVNFFRNPFSIQMSLLSHLFVHAVNLYNFEDSIMKKFVPFSSATDIAFVLTFLVVGTFLGILLTCVFGIFQVLFMEPEESDDLEETEEKNKKLDEKDESENATKTTEDSSTVRKRK